MYQCSKCGAEKPETEFTTWPRNKWCKSCCAAYQRDLRQRKPGYQGTGRNKALDALSPEDRAIRDRLARARVDAMQRIRKYKLVDDLLSEADLLSKWTTQAGKCAISGLPLSVETHSPWIISLDQILPGAGYSCDNVQLVAWAANRAKGDLTQEDFLVLCKAVVSLAQD
jgi:hypothetical protein